MTAKSRRRKIEKKLKRSNDANSYPEDVRRSEEGGADRTDLKPLTAKVIKSAQLRSVSFVKEGEGTGYIVTEAGEWKGLAPEYITIDELQHFIEEPGKGGTIRAEAEAAFRAEASPDAASVFERGTASVPKQHFEGWLDEAKEDVREALFQDVQRRHQLFFKVMGNPNYVGSEPCFCELAKNHSTFI